MRVYFIENTINGKRYVGVTTDTLENRFKQHFAKTKDDKNNQLIVKAIAKHGKENFVIRELETCDSIEQMLERERYWIQELKTFCNDPLHHGYNMTLGGEGVFGLVRTKEQRQHLSFIHKRENLTEETIRRMSNAAKNRVPSSQETRKKISEALKGENNPCYGKSWGRSGPLREETKQKISESRKGIKLSEEHKRKIGEATKRRKGPNLGKKFTDEKLFLKRIAMQQKKKPVIVYLDEQPSYICFSVNDAIVQTGVSCRKINRSIKQRDKVNGFLFEKSDMSIEELRLAKTTIALFIKTLSSLSGERVEA